MLRAFIFNRIIDMVEFKSTVLLFVSVCPICSLFPFPSVFAFFWVNCVFFMILFDFYYQFIPSYFIMFLVVA